MPRTRFQQIRGALTLHPPEHPSFDREHDPLWRCCGVMEHFQKQFAAFAVPLCVSSIDEMTVRTKARTRAKTFMPSKPDKYGLRFYAVVGWSSLYVHSLWANSSDTQVSFQLYEQHFTIRCEMKVFLVMDSDAGHETRALRSPTGHRLVVSDKFYTRHTFARALLKFTDGEMHLLGTVRINFVDKWNKSAVSAAVEQVDNGVRGDLALVVAVDPEPQWKQSIKGIRQHSNALQRQSELNTKPLEGGLILPSTSAEAVYSIRRWTEDRTLHRQEFMTPTIIAAYNLCMNGVDRVDQLRSTYPIRRREKRLGMTMITWLTDITIINA
ncbi:hypothetical protein PHMEG_000336 [Phytophthora megakarya]|uniref:PiggyBac transposable element-derived protein domain-containing protein n=1 Tax=Phytophthora megakarya TaxID=4795 RepID=A0A225X3U0_9STRA|nr:hypothetical protein PHMEG_000336 [Phytophthora megakarya]